MNFHEIALGSRALEKTKSIFLTLIAQALFIPAFHAQMRLEEIAPIQSGLEFENLLNEDNEINYSTYPFIYFGNGVAAGDLDNDGLPDLVFAANRGDNRIFRNRGDFTFEDVTESSGLLEKPAWANGVTLADVNADGRLDLYFCNSGMWDSRANQLFINRGNFSFVESADDYGIGDRGPSSQAAFFDYDRDGDLDLYVAAYPQYSIATPAYAYSELRRSGRPIDSDHLYRNNGDGTFSDVTQAAGVKNWGRTLGLSISDFNNDGWQDVYVSNDFATPDYFYINNGDGTFSERSRQAMRHTAFFGMGSDAADFNNDGMTDILQLDMMAEDNQAQKTNMSGMDRKAFWQVVRMGLHHQYMRNVLNLNNGNGTFSDVAELSSVDSTDWSWAGLMADLNNDGWKDILITNGMRRSVNDNDFRLRNEARAKDGSLETMSAFELLEDVPVDPISNYVFENNGDLTFSNRSADWGFDFKGFSAGATLADLDADGDLDVALNNTDGPATLHRNHADRLGHHWTQLRLQNPGPNLNALGARVTIITGESTQTIENTPTRGYFSSLPPTLHAGLGKAKRIDEIRVLWPDGAGERFGPLPVDRVLTIVRDEGTPISAALALQPSLHKAKSFEIAEWTVPGARFTHKENDYDDLDREILLPHLMSRWGPCIAVEDVNADGLDDFYVGGARGQSGTLFIQETNGAFRQTEPENSPWQSHAKREDTGAAFFDANSDGLPDLYVASGGNEVTTGHPELEDRLYINQGKGGFVDASDRLPEIGASASSVLPADFDQDGDFDLFVGGRQEPGSYPLPGRSVLLENRDGAFVDVTNARGPQLERLGMVTSGAWSDFDGDGSLDLLVAGEWMPLRIFLQKDGSFSEASDQFDLGRRTGWWFSLKTLDVDGDGDLDIVAGNNGLNYKYKASQNKPFHLNFADFDNNGSKDIVLGYEQNGKRYPVRGRECSAFQVPVIKKRFPTYKAFSIATVFDIYGQEEISEALHLTVTDFGSGVFLRGDSGTFEFKRFPNAAQTSATMGIVDHDFDRDGQVDLLLAGNLYVSEVETPRNDAGNGTILLNRGPGSFEEVVSYQSGFFAPHDIRALASIRIAGNDAIIVVNNDGPLQIFRIGPQTP